MNQAKCREMDLAIFFGKDRRGASRHRPSLTSVEIRRAKAICAVCPVLWECFTYAMEQEEDYGVWGGTTHKDRQRIREQAEQVSDNSFSRSFLV